jgi:hypothetical protein
MDGPCEQGTRDWLPMGLGLSLPHTLSFSFIFKTQILSLLLSELKLLLVEENNNT